MNHLLGWFSFLHAEKIYNNIMLTRVEGKDEKNIHCRRGA